MLLANDKVKLVDGLHVISSEDLEVGDVIQLHGNDLDYFTYTDDSAQWLMVTKTKVLNADGTFSFVAEGISRKVIRGQEERPLLTPGAIQYEFRLNWNEEVIPRFHYRGSAALYAKEGELFYSHFDRTPRE